MAEVKRVNDRLMASKLLVEGVSLDVVSVYFSQARLEEEVKQRFLRELDELMQGFPLKEKLFIGGDHNGSST